jgi:hypothetical protein
VRSTKPDSREPEVIEPALPSWKAFVIQLSHDTTPESGIFAVAYADQTERDHAIFKKAARSGRVQVDMEEERG